MEMPKLVRQHQKLEKFVGTWTGSEVMHPAPWAPDGAETEGTLKCKLDYGGWYVRMDYVQKHGRKTAMKGLGVLGYNSIEKNYTFAWFDSGGGSADNGVTRGQWKGQKLSLTNKTPYGHMRVSYSFGKNDVLNFKMEMSEDGEQWAPCMTAKYTKKS